MSRPYYEGDGVTLYHGDCREVTEWLTADVLVTDPPYGIAHKGHSRQVAPVDLIVGDESFDIARTVIELAQHIPMAVCASHSSLTSTLNAVRSRHDRTRVMTWFKSNVNGGSGGGNPWMSDVEFIVCGVLEWPNIYVSGLVNARRFTGNPACNANPDAYLHPTQKPVQVMERVIQAMPMGVIADPCAGSGSTLAAARLQGRKAIGVEVVEKYCERAARRLDQGVLEFPA